MKFETTIDGRDLQIEIDHDHLVRVDGNCLYVALEQVGHLPLYTLNLDGKEYLIFVDRQNGEYRVEIQDHTYPVDVKRQHPKIQRPDGECGPEGAGCLDVCAPLAGRLHTLLVTKGERIPADHVVAIVESMKMQMQIKAPVAAVVDTVYGPADRDISQGEPLVQLTPCT